jgi:hypothetical protein
MTGLAPPVGPELVRAIGGADIVAVLISLELQAVEAVLGVLGEEPALRVGASGGLGEGGDHAGSPFSRVTAVWVSAER